jgi:hypothetical protein
VDGASGVVTNRVELAGYVGEDSAPHLVASPKGLLATWPSSGSFGGSSLHIRVFSDPALGVTPLPSRHRRAAGPRWWTWPSAEIGWQHLPGPVVFDGTNFVQFFLAYHDGSDPVNDHATLTRTVFTPDGAVLVEDEYVAELDGVPALMSATSVNGAVTLALWVRTFGPPYGATTRLFWVVP